jgi:hypothetical protein
MQPVKYPTPWKLAVSTLSLFFTHQRSAATAMFSSTLQPDVLSEIIDKLIFQITPPLVYLVFVTILSSMLVPLLVALFHYSSSKTRRQPVFIANVLALIGAISLGIFNIYIEVRSTPPRYRNPRHLISFNLQGGVFFSPLSGTRPTVYIAWAGLFALTPWMTEAILFIRLIAVYPLSTLGIARFSMVLGPPVVFSIIRIIALVSYIKKWAQIALSVPSSDVQAAVGHMWTLSPWLRAALFLQIIDNASAHGYYTVCWIRV